MRDAIHMDERLLDRIAAERAQNIVDNAVQNGDVKAKQVDNLVTKALGVLQENGVYACFLFLFSRTRKEDKAVAEVVKAQLLQLAGENLPFDWQTLASLADSGSRDVLPEVSKTICGELDPLLMTKDVFEQTLIYARYTAKARDKEGD
jgi:hypothetical protein